MELVGVRVGLVRVKVGLVGSFWGFGVSEG